MRLVPVSKKLPDLREVDAGPKEPELRVKLWLDRSDDWQISVLVDGDRVRSYDTLCKSPPSRRKIKEQVRLAKRDLRRAGRYSAARAVNTEFIVR